MDRVSIAGANPRRDRQQRRERKFGALRRAARGCVFASCLAFIVGCGADSEEDQMQAGAARATETDRTTSAAPIDAQIVMFYYDDLAAPAAFYGETLGLKPTQDFGWAKLFQIVPGSEVGIVKAGPGAYYTPQARNAVMLSIVTSDVDAWYERLKANPNVEFLVELQTQSGAPIRNFMIRDPGGYTVEFFQWLERR